MPTECSPDLFGFAPVEGREVVAAFDGGRDHLGCRGAAAGRDGSRDRDDGSVCGVLSRRAASGTDRARGGDPGRPAGVRDRARLRGSQRPRRAAPRSDDGGAGGQARGAARGLRAGGRQVDAQPAGAEPAGADALSQDQPQSGGDQAASGRPVPGGARARTERRSFSISMRPTIRCTASRRGGSSTAITTATATCRSTCSAGAICWPPSCGARTSTRRPGAVEEVARIVAQIRRRWPRVRILLRADCGFAREELMAWCEANGVDFLFGLAQERAAHRRDQGRARAGRGEEPADRQAGAALQGLHVDDARQLEPPAPGRGQGRVDARTRPIRASSSPRSRAPSARPRYLYEKVYCARGDMENRIKECQLDLYADRTSTATMRANQLRLWFASMAYVLLCALRRIGLHHTAFAKATCGTIRLKLLKIGALVRVSVRRIKIAMASACPAAQTWGCAAIRLAAAANAPRLARLTRAAATRNPRGIHPQAHRDHFFAAPAARKVPALSRLLHATGRMPTRTLTRRLTKSSRSQMIR